MHATMTRAGLALLILATVAVTLLLLGIAPADGTTAMPGACPPSC